MEIKLIIPPDVTSSINLNYTKLVNFLIELTKKYCLESEWKSLEQDFYAFYTSPDKISKIARMIKEEHLECNFVIKLLNEMYIYTPGSKSAFSRQLAKSVARRCNTNTDYSFP